MLAPRSPADAAGTDPEHLGQRGVHPAGVDGAGPALGDPGDDERVLGGDPLDRLAVDTARKNLPPSEVGVVCLDSTNVPPAWWRSRNSTWPGAWSAASCSDPVHRWRRWSTSWSSPAVAVVAEGATWSMGTFLSPQAWLRWGNG